MHRQAVALYQDDTYSPLMPAIREELRATIHAAGAPYGYTLTIWASGSITIRSRSDEPTLLGLLFVVGAITGFVTLARVAAGPSRSTVPRPSSPSGDTHVLAFAHLVACGAAIGTAAVVLRVIPGPAGAAVTGMAVTITYVMLCAVQFTLAHTVGGRPQDPPAGVG